MDFFRKAVPVFIAGKSGTVNSQAAFRTVFTARAGREYTLILTGSTLYRVWLNGEVVHYGPARGPHGYVRVDRISLAVRDGENYLAVEVAGYNCPSFYTMDILSFLQAELCEDGNVIRFTAVNGDFEGVSLEGIRARKCIRYSYQRAFTEVWRLTGKAADGVWNAIWSLDAELLETVDHGKKYMEREWKLPYLGLSPEAVPYERGEFRKKDGFDCYDKRFTRISDEVVGYRCEELSDDVLAAMYGDMIPVEGDLSMPLTVSAGDYAALDFGRIYAGFIRLTFRAKVKTTAYIFFSEMPRDGRIDIGVERQEKIDIIKLDIDPADETRTFESFECYSLKYLGVMVESGEIDIRAGALGRVYAHSLKRSRHDIVDLDVRRAVLLTRSDESERRVDKAHLVAVSANEIDAVDPRGLSRVQLRVAAGDEYVCLRIVSRRAADHLARLAVALRRNRACIDYVNAALL